MYLETQITSLQLRRRCQEYEGELGRLAAELQALLPAPLVRITVNSHFLPREDGPSGEEAQEPAAKLPVSEGPPEATPGGQPLPFWCSQIARLVRSLTLLLRGMNGLAQSEGEPDSQTPQVAPREVPAGPLWSTAQREIQECGVSVRTLRGTFESLLGSPCTPHSSSCEQAARSGQCTGGCWLGGPQPCGNPSAGVLGSADTEETSDSGISCEEASSEVGPSLGPDPASLRKERIVLLFLSHWKKSAYTPALRTAACQTLQARRKNPQPPSPPPGPRLSHVWQQRGIIAHLLGTWKAILAHVPARQLRRLSRQPRHPLSPEQFLPHVNGAPLPYDGLSLDLFMLGYFQLLECELPAEERKMRHLLCFEVFEHLGVHGWEAARAFHKAVTDEVAAGRRTWTDGFEDIKARFFGSSGHPAWDLEPGSKSGLTTLPQAKSDPSSGAEPPESPSQRGSFNSEDICGYIDRSFAFWKEKEAEMFAFGE